MKLLFEKTTLVKKTAIAIALGASIVALSACNKSGAGSTNSGSKGSSTQSEPVSASNATSVIKKITQGQFEIKQQFKVAGHGLTGYVLESKHGGQPIIFYSNDKTGDVFYGMLFDKHGKNLTQSYIKEHITPILAKKLFDNVGNTDFFLIGKADAPHQIYVVGEPNCSICHKLYVDLKPFVEKGDLSIRWIMTAFLRPDSLGKAAAILQSKDPAAMLAKDESSKYSYKTEEGAIKALPKDQITEATKAAIKENMAFMSKNGINGTPAVFYMDNKGQPQRIDGYPQESLKTLVKSIGKLPAVSKKPASSASTKPMSKLTPAHKTDEAKKQS